MPARALLSGFAIPYNISISLSCGFAFGYGFDFPVVYPQHLALKNLAENVTEKKYKEGVWASCKRLKDLANKGRL